jgi:hypothetical protein
MIRFLVLMTFLHAFNISFSQTAKIDLAKITTVSDATMFIEKNPGLNCKLFTIKSSVDTSEILIPLYTKSKGFNFKIDNYNYKILQTDSTLSFRVSYIYLNGEQLSKRLIDSVRQVIISKYKHGISFLDLAHEYNMDGNITGDTGWFTENMMVKEFEVAVRNHKKEDIFTVDTPDRSWYHVVLKTYDDTYIKKLTLLKTKSGS